MSFWILANLQILWVIRKKTRQGTCRKSPRWHCPRSRKRKTPKGAAALKASRDILRRANVVGGVFCSNSLLPTEKTILHRSELIVFIHGLSVRMAGSTQTATSKYYDTSMYFEVSHFSEPSRTRFWTKVGGMSRCRGQKHVRRRTRQQAARAKAATAIR